MKISYESTYKLYMCAYLTLNFPNLAVHSFSLRHQCFFNFFFLNLPHAGFNLDCIECDFTLQTKVQNFPSC